MVVMSLEMYSEPTDETDMKLKEANQAAKAVSRRPESDEVFTRAGRRISRNENK